MAREFKWEEITPEHAVLYGPEPYMVAAVIIMECPEPDPQDACWRVMSGLYPSLNFAEENTGIPLEQLKRRVLIQLGSDLEKWKKGIEEDISNVLGMVFGEMET